jgi:phenylalanyl-tRNA synthetase beta chain
LPVIRIRTERLMDLTGLSPSELVDMLFKLKCESEEIEPGILEIEVNPDRPDMLIGEGIARAVNGLSGRETGYKGYPVYDTDITVTVGPVGSRRYVAIGVVRNVNVDEDYLEEIIQFQEKLHVTFGRRRRKAAIGLHDLSKLPCRKLEYKYLNPREIRFKPLHIDREMSGEEVLKETDQGRAYGQINLESSGHPFLLACGEVIAMPPVINSDLTRVEPGTKDLLVDVTGPDKATVLKLLDVIVTDLAERKGAMIGRVRIETQDGVVNTPNLQEDQMILSHKYTNDVLGINIDPKDQVMLLERMRYKAEYNGESINTVIPPYRVDVISPIDLVEDIAIALGYDSIPRKSGWPSLRGHLTPLTLFSRVVREVLVGAGYTEVVQLVLTGPSAIKNYWSKDELVEIGNPVMVEYSILRPSLIPGLLQVAKSNLSASKPVRAFEIGPIVKRNSGAIEEKTSLGILYMDDEASYEQLQAVVYKLFRIIGVEPIVKPGFHPLLVEGRTGEIRSPSGSYIGVIGEVKPQVLLDYGIDYPAIIGEVDLEELMEAASWNG